MGSDNNTGMERRLLVSPKSRSDGGDESSAAGDGALTWSVFIQELKRLGYIAGPMVAVNLSQYLLQVISLMMVGHLGELELSSTAIAVSLSSVTGFSVLIGMSSALETLCGQAYGAGQYRKLGTQTYTAVFCLLLACIPLTLLWLNMESILIFVGQDPTISHEVGKLQIWLVPSLFAYALAQPILRYLQAQSLVAPMLTTAGVTVCFHVPLCWGLVFKSGLRNVGAALAMCLSNWLSFVILALYVKCSPSCAKTRVPVSMELFRDIGVFFRYAVPSTVMICLEWWSFELVVLLSGLLPNPELETSVLSVCLNTIATLYSIPFGLGAAASTRVSNELGRGNPEAARVSVRTVMSVAAAEALLVSSSLFMSRRVFGYSFSDEKEVVDYVTKMAPLLCLSVIMDSLQGVLSGVARGCGWQHIGAYINLGAFYLCGFPVGIVLGFWTNLRGMGLWIGVLVGAVAQTVLLFVVTMCTNWEKQPAEAENNGMEQSLLLLPQKSVGGDEDGGGVYIQEAKRLCTIALPMAAINLSMGALNIISLMMVGHLGELSLSSSAIAISLSNVTCFSLLVGMSSGLETLNGQAYGAQQYRKLAVQTYTAIFSLISVCIFLSLAWFNMESLLVLIGQDPVIAHEAGAFTRWLVPAFFAAAVYQPLVKYYLAQSLITPMLLCSCVTIFLHVPLCWVLIFKTGLNNFGGALSVGISYWLNVVFLVLYMAFSPTCAKTRAPVSMELFRGVGEFFRFAIPSAIMICLQWWSYEFVIMLSGLLPNPQLETSVLSICLTTIGTLFAIPYGLGAAVSTRVANELGAGNPQAARRSVYTIMILGVAELAVVGGILFAGRQMFGYLFSGETEVVEDVSKMAPLVCLSIVVDGLQEILSGVARGCGWQHIGAYVNLAALYLCGIPVAGLLGFVFQLRGKGLWIGILIGATLQTLLLAVVTFCTNWEKQVCLVQCRY
ncbi:unnamed protein product [Linum tenue]|uniref:Protein DETOXIFICATION n=1 Tax=Linum tenue TaxID=586396 RepID=A0AAV0I6N3_9ROSI|nr:unnamed protein product [Linum tenue]